MIHAQSLILKKMNDLEKNQEKIQKELKELVDRLEDNLN